jgi:hypothetical protein
LDLARSTSLALLGYETVGDRSSRNSVVLVLLCRRCLGQPGLLACSLRVITLVFTITIFIVTAFVPFCFVVNLVTFWATKFLCPFVIPFRKERLGTRYSKNKSAQSFLLTLEPDLTPFQDAVITWSVRMRLYD